MRGDAMGGWRQDTQAIIRQYPKLKRKLEALRRQSLTANYNGMPGSGEARRTTEDTALVTLPPEEQRRFDAVDQTVRTTKQRYYNGRMRVDAIRMMYWSCHRLTADGVALKLNYSVETIWRWNSEFEACVHTLYSAKDVSKH